MQKALNVSEIADIIRRHNPDCRFKIKTYDYIDQFRDASSLMRGIDALVILYRTKPTFGHWVVLTKCDTDRYREYIKHVYNVDTDLPVFCFCDSYGMMVDSELKFVPEDLKQMLGETFPKLRDMLNNCRNVVEYNHHHLQSDTSNTCGRFAALRAADYEIPLEEWINNRFKGKSADKTIVAMTGGVIKSKSDSMFGGKRRSKSKSKRKRIGYNGNVIQTVKIHIGSKPKAEKPFYVDDSRLDYKNPFANPKPTRSQIREVIRPSQASVFPSQIQVVQHNPNGLITSNLQLAGAISELANSLPKLRTGISNFAASKVEEKKFLEQSSNIGGTVDPVQVASQEEGQNSQLANGSRQRALEAANQESAIRLATEPMERPRTDIDPQVAAQLEVQNIAITAEQHGTRNLVPPGDAVNHPGPTQIQGADNRVPVTLVRLPEVPNTFRQAGPENIKIPRPMSQNLSAFPLLGGRGTSMSVARSPPRTMSYDPIDPTRMQSRYTDRRNEGTAAMERERLNPRPPGTATALNHLASIYNHDDVSPSSSQIFFRQNALDLTGIPEPAAGRLKKHKSKKTHGKYH